MQKRILAVILMAMWTLTGQAQTSPGEILYGMCDGAGIEKHNLIYQIDSDSGFLSSMVQLNVSGHAVARAKALAARPSDNSLWGILTFVESPAVDQLVTINPATGVCSLVRGLSNNYESIAFRHANGLLYGVTGVDGITPETLFTIDTGSSGNETLIYGLPNYAQYGPSDSIAFGPLQNGGTLYRSTGDCPAALERCNIDAHTCQPLDVSPCTGALGLSWSRVHGMMYLSNQYSHLYTVSLLFPNARTFIACMLNQLPGCTCYEPCVTNNKALAFVPPL